MELAISALEAAKESGNSNQTQSHLLAAAVVYYARPFSRGRNWSGISKKVEKFDDKALQDLHNLIKVWRDAAIAHSDEDLNDVEFIPKGAKLHFRSQEGQEHELQMAFVGEFVQRPKFPRETIQEFLRLCHFQKERMNRQSSKEKDALFEEFKKGTGNS